MAEVQSRGPRGRFLAHRVGPDGRASVDGVAALLCPRAASGSAAGSVGPRRRGERSLFPTRVSAGRRRRAHGLSARGPRSRSPACAEAWDVRPGRERGRGPVSALAAERASAVEAWTAPGDPRPAAASECAL